MTDTIGQRVKRYEDATRSLLDIPIRDQIEYDKWVIWLQRWSDPEVTKHLPLPQEWVDTIRSQTTEFKNRTAK